MSAMKNFSQERRPKGRPRGFDRAMALDAAMRLFWTRGYEATSISELASAMRVNPPSLYAAFGDKRQLFAEAVERYRADHGSFASEALAGAHSARDAVQRLLDRAAEAYTDPACPAGCMVIHSAQNCSADDDEVAESLARIRGAMQDAIRVRIEEGQRSSELPSGTGPAELAAFYAAIIQGMSTMSRDGATFEQLRAIAGLAMQAWPAKAGSGDV